MCRRDGAEKARIEPFSRSAASAVGKGLALQIKQFQPSPPQPTAVLLSCHRKPAFLSMPFKDVKPAPIHSMIRQGCNAAIIVDVSSKRQRTARLDDQMEQANAAGKALARREHRR